MRHEARRPAHPPPAAHRRLLDTLGLARAALPDTKSHALGALRQHFGLALPQGEAEHDAGTDVVTLARLLPPLLQVPWPVPALEGLEESRPSRHAHAWLPAAHVCTLLGV